MSEPEYRVAGLVVRCKPENSESVRQQLEAMPGIEVHGVNIDGGMAVTAEEQPGEHLVDAVERVNLVPGVVDMSLTYSHTE
ncbi:chaperone NapD [Pelagibaculum spongiae]|uniref:Chaperone NapD n=1 Tax=Pelagibaculum spongiae TaxID=2080658 RepID=A0A2V1GVK7_9GAMM|nr:chaperone NapD [Pelagibaculum spongiae]PVZ68983.1 hypothetical protein DC094_12115 [Pelagibaculum spongiae]